MLSFHIAAPAKIIKTKFSLQLVITKIEGQAKGLRVGNVFFLRSLLQLIHVRLNTRQQRKRMEEQQGAVQVNFHQGPYRGCVRFLGLCGTGRGGL